MSIPEIICYIIAIPAIIVAWFFIFICIIYVIKDEIEEHTLRNLIKELFIFIFHRKKKR